MARLQLALRVADLDRATAFYTTLFGVGPHKQREGYVNFAVDDPPVKLVLLESGSASDAELDHLGIEVDTTDEVAAAVERYREAGLAVDVREQELCCHAVQDKLWLDGADGARWEVYTVTDDRLGSDDGVLIEAAEATATTCAGDGCDCC